MTNQRDAYCGVVTTGQNKMRVRVKLQVSEALDRGLMDFAAPLILEQC